MAPRIHVLHSYYEDRAQIPLSCTYIRLLRPLTHPGFGAGATLTHGTSEAFPDCDLLVVERHVLWAYERQLDGFARVFARCRRQGIPVIYELDDNLLDLHLFRPWESFPTDHLRGVVAFLAREATGVIVSTPALQERLSRLAPDAVVVPNALDERLFGAPPEPHAPDGILTIGYMGTMTHEADLRMILAPLRAILRRLAGRARLELVGAADRRVSSLFEGLPYRYRTPGHEHPYPRFAAWMRENLKWDFAIAPLHDDTFTRCKSDLKYLDYGALAIPGVFSDVRPYRESVRNRATGLLVPNDDASWAAALEELAGDSALRARLARAARDDAHGSHMLRTNAVRWRDAIERIVPGFFG